MRLSPINNSLTSSLTQPVVADRHYSTRRSGFTLIELLVVIGIIVLLIGILLPALAAVNKAAKKTETQATMNEFAKACDLFFQTHGFYPGVVPENILAADAGGGAPQLSSTENALLHLMGGFVREADVTPAEYASFTTANGWEEITLNGTYRIKVNPDEMGTGPTIQGKRYDSYFSPGQDELVITSGQVGEPGNVQLPDLLDAWGQPIIFTKRARGIGVLIGEQFIFAGALPYLESLELGELNRPQQDPGGGAVEYSALNPSGGTAGCNGAFSLVNWNLMMLIGHPSFSTGDCGSGTLQYDTARGDYLLLSAGADGVFLSQTDGPGTPSNPTDEIETGTALELYDDIIIMGGGS